MTTLYQAFPIQGAQTRVVDILPGSEPDAIAFECRVISPDNGDSYEALSYVWGDAAATRTVSISGYRVEITETLYTAFERLRSPDSKRTLWADQVSINQTDDEEKGHQVILMRTIYKQCSECLIWFGRIPSDQGFATLDAKAALDFIHSVADTKFADLQADSRFKTFIAENDRGVRTRKAFKALIMGGNPWWSRVWTVQEAVLPSAATLHWGPFTIPLKTMELAAQEKELMLKCPDVESNRVQEEYFNLLIKFVHSVRSIRSPRKGEEPFTTLMRWRCREATDPRDKLYGFIGLFRSGTLASIPALRDISYSIAPAVLFTQVTLDLIRSCQNLRPLLFARKLRHATPELPTWAIDFASSSSTVDRNRSLRNSRRPWAASKGVGLQFEGSGDVGSLFLSGKSIDYVEKISNIYRVSTEEKPRKGKLREAMEEPYRMLEGYQTSHGSDMDADYVGGGSLRDAFWKTVKQKSTWLVVSLDVPEDSDLADMEEYIMDSTAIPTAFFRSFDMSVPNSTFFITSMGYLGLGPVDLRENDHVYIFQGGKVPFVVRPVADNNREAQNVESSKFHLIDDAYVHGIMSGEIVAKKEDLTVVELV
ncbi:hypothetical protein P280DRAFT_473023 [Massarina eburnea CBS 473.64]|uniref:Heterokaryon incompatibility domain-containing protein n=1 Tax=Massarina eburnea CBS 473.64 TaxID=1395130 RepID=A0A6A6RMU3_9PLEO|nr:hypothetical protein P280DRAFT_473023 [Massarina eburnea CBS 473.64]